MASERPDFSVSIACWNNLAMLSDCIRSLLATRGSLSLEILVIDDASEPPLAEPIHQEFPDVIVLRNHRHQSFSHSHNRGLGRATGKYLIVLNDDTYVHEGALQAIYDEFEASPEVGMVAARVETPEGEVASGAIRPERTLCELITRYNYTRLRKLQWRLDPKYYDGETKHDIEVSSGACMTVRRAALEEIGLLDEGFPFLFEGTDWMLRVRKAGWPIRYVPEARVTHLEGASIGKIELGRELRHYYGTRHYLHKWFCPCWVALHRALTVANYFLRSLYWRIVALVKPHDSSTIPRAVGYWRMLLKILRDSEYGDD